MDTHPARIVELAMPCAAPLEFGLGFRVGHFAVVAPVARDVLFEPRTQLEAEGFIGFAEFEIHRARLPAQLAPMLEFHREAARPSRSAPLEKRAPFAKATGIDSSIN